MKHHPTAIWTVLVLCSSLCTPLSAQQAAAWEQEGWDLMMRWDYSGMPGWGPGEHRGLGMRAGDYASLDLGSEQRRRINVIEQDLRRKQWPLMRRMRHTMRSVALYRNGKFDEHAVRQGQAEAEAIRRQMFENRLDAHKQVDALLTPQQRQQLSQHGR